MTPRTRNYLSSLLTVFAGTSMTFAGDAYWLSSAVDTTWINANNWSSSAVPDSTTRAFITPLVNESAVVILPHQVPNLDVVVDELTIGGSGGTTSFVIKKNGTLTVTNGMHVLSGTTVSGGALVFGDVTFHAGSKLGATICGCDGVMNISGHTTLDGTLAFRAQQGMLPAIGQSRFMLMSTDMSGEFDETVNETGLAGLKTTTYYTNAGVLVNWDTFLDGDVDVDGTVGFNDLLTLAQHYVTPSGATHYDGDLNHDTAVDFEDLLIVAQDYGQSMDGLNANVGSSFESDWQLALVSVPEPTTLTLLALVPLALRRCHR